MNPKACYLVVDGDRFYYRWIAYDLKKTISKIYKIDRLHNFLGDRLRGYEKYKDL